MNSTLPHSTKGRGGMVVRIEGFFGGDGFCLLLQLKHFLLFLIEGPA